MKPPRRKSEDDLVEDMAAMGLGVSLASKPLDVKPGAVPPASAEPGQDCSSEEDDLLDLFS